ncbi:hypothetical protein NPIL_523771 [Nephila pilipes]|uniref:Uncharacterized protein n=1 Tax=Nephila pilipes TaxID=299642 RepID=A0A8X6T9K1_NEPPI|nr:hypothetical protein NPIL_523771 [Nephila pilipes]
MSHFVITDLRALYCSGNHRHNVIAKTMDFTAKNTVFYHYSKYRLPQIVVATGDRNLLTTGLSSSPLLSRYAPTERPSHYLGINEPSHTLLMLLDYTATST